MCHDSRGHRFRPADPLGCRTRRQNGKSGEKAPRAPKTSPRVAPKASRQVRRSGRIMTKPKTPARDGNDRSIDIHVSFGWGCTSGQCHEPKRTGKQILPSPKYRDEFVTYLRRCRVPGAVNRTTV